MALLITSVILLLPANLMTIMVSSNPTVIERSTIFSGIQFMWRDGDHYIAMIIFSASIMLPWLKIISMGVLLYAAKFGTKMAPQKLSKLYLTQSQKTNASHIFGGVNENSLDRKSVV